MVAALHVPGRLILAGGFAVAMAIAPAAAVVAEINSPGVSVTADPNQNCTVNQSNGSDSLVCTPPSFTPNRHLPSEQGLTLQNQLHPEDRALNHG
jgi:hypothetical protein